MIAFSHLDDFTLGHSVQFASGFSWFFNRSTTRFVKFCFTLSKSAKYLFQPFCHRFLVGFSDFAVYRLTPSTCPLLKMFVLQLHHN